MDGLIRLMEGENTGPINIGNPGEFTMIELAETVKEVSLIYFIFFSVWNHKGLEWNGMGDYIPFHVL